jgi:hypothetical protein
MSAWLKRSALPVILLVVGAYGITAIRAQITDPLTITVLSGRPDMVTGGDALIRLSGRAMSSSSPVTLALNGRDITASLQQGTGTILLTGLPMGKRTLTARGSSESAALELTNYPITGPVFSGPHQKPFVCQTEAWQLGPALDENCSAKTRVEWMYKSTTPAQGRGASAFKPLPAGLRPADLAEAVFNGRRVPYIVRLETGTINRAVYQIAMIFDPGVPIAADAVPFGWNGRLVYTFGGSCMAGYIQGRSSGGVMNDNLLSRGYAVASSSLNVFGNNCNGVLSAETLMMVKERFIETFGVPVHTIGSGGSGGAMAQYVIAQNYPGLLDGIIPSATFPDHTSYFIESEDCRMLLRPYLNKTALTEEQKRTIGGFSTWGTCDRSYANRPGRLDPTDCDAGIPKELRYDPVTNPKGARCSIYDGMVNIFGRDSKTGFARRPHDNVGVQYGLGALNRGEIPKDVFLDLNEKIGGYDIDAKWQPERNVGDLEAIRIAYESGMTMTGGGGLKDTPIIDVRNYSDPSGDFHESYHSFKARARLIRENGHADNQVMLRGAGASFSAVSSEVVARMDKWLDAIDADTTNRPRAQKIVRARPADLTDGCVTSDGRFIAEKAVYGGPGECNTLYPPHSAPRLEAGAPLTDDVWKCQLKSIEPRDYKVAFSEAEMARLRRIFSSGVCDWSKPGVNAKPVAGVWRRY